MSEIDSGEGRVKQRIDNCTNCRLPLPLRLTEPGEQAASWECAGCGARYVGILDGESGPEAHRNVRLADVHFDPTSMAGPPRAMADFIAKLAANEAETHEHRRAKRYSTTFATVAVPLDPEFNPIGEVFTAMVHNISQQGLSLIHTRAVREQYLAVELPTSNEHTIQVVLRVVRCRAIGRFYEIAGEIVARLGK